MSQVTKDWTLLVDYLTRLSCTFQQWFDSYLTHLSWSFFKQSLLKQILTDGGPYTSLLHCLPYTSLSPSYTLSPSLSLPLLLYLSLSFYNPLSPQLLTCVPFLCAGERYVMTLFGVLNFAEQGQ